VLGGTGRLGSVFGLVQVIENTGRFNYPFYRDKLNVAFKNYLETIARSNKYGIYTPKDPDSSEYFNRAEVLLRMLLRDGRDCFDERNWTAGFVDDGAFLITSPRCGLVRWSKEEIASLIAAADTDILRREVLRPLYKDSLDWYNAVAGLFIPSEAALSFSLLSGTTKPQQVAINAGRMRFQKLSALKRSIDAKSFIFPGAKVLVWGTAFEAEIGPDGSGTAYVEEDMPVLANLNGTAPDAYGVTWQDNPLGLAAPPGSEPLDLPYRTDSQAPFVIDVTPNENSAVTPDNLVIQIHFSQAMDANSVTSHGLLTITHSAPGDFFAGHLGDLPHAWDGIQTTLTLTPTTLPNPGVYVLDLHLPPEVVSLAGWPAAGTPLSTTFAVALPVGASGGTVGTPSGASATIPPGATGAQPAVLETTIQITASRVFSTPEGWLSAEGLVYHFSPKGQTFNALPTISLPLPEFREGAAILGYVDGAWQVLGGQQSPDGTQISVQVDELAAFGAFWPIPSSRRVYLPQIQRGSGSESGPGVAAGWQCHPFAGGVSCGQQLTDISMGAPDDGWAVGPEILLHYADGQWRRVVDSDLDLFDGNLPDFNAVDMLSADEGWAVGYGGWLAHYVNGVWYTSRPFFETYNGVDMLSVDDGWIAAANGMTYHYNGADWQAVSTPTDKPLYDIEMVAAGDVWAVGGDNTPTSVILHYTAGSWQQVSSPSTRPLYAIDMLSATEGWAVGQSGTLLHYQSGVWSQVSSPTTADLNDVQMLSAGEGWAVDAKGLIYHYQSGTWTEVSGQDPNQNHGLDALAIFSPTEVWAVGELGRMFYSQDDGPWQQFAGVSHDLSLLSAWYNTIDMTSTTDGWAAGKLGGILHYNGSTWSPATSPTTDEIWDLDMISAGEGWAVASAGWTGASSAFLRYAGGSWQVVHSQSDVQLRGIDMVSADEGWAVGRSGIIMRYNGASWGFAPSPTLEDLNAVAMVSADRGWAVGDNGTILSYETGVWSQVSSPTSEDLHDLSVVSELEAWAVGDNTTILRSFLGSWFQVDLSVAAGLSDLEAIHMLPNGEGWAAGFLDATLLHYRDGEWQLYARDWAAAHDIDFTPNGEGWMVGYWFHGLLIHYR
ncbi:MAG: hypothetical protein PVH17_12535, partial [Anaerolineae bacterium]